MSVVTARGATVPAVRHHEIEVGGAELHYVSAGDSGSPVLLVHGFPETWWTFHRLIPKLSERHRVVAVDLRGFGDSAVAGPEYSSTAAAGDLAALIERLDVGPVHLTGQDLSGAPAYRLAATRPELVRSFTGIETGLPGFGAEALADITRGGAWYIGVLVTPGIADLLLPGRERSVLDEHLIPALTPDPTVFIDEDLDELVRSYSRPHGFAGSTALFRSLLSDGPELCELATRKLTLPTLAVGGSGGEFTAAALRQVAADVTAVQLDGIGHHVAMEAPDRLAEALRTFWAGVDGS